MKKKWLWFGGGALVLFWLTKGYWRLRNGIPSLGHWGTAANAKPNDPLVWYWSDGTIDTSADPKSIWS